jgi:hypothetical protein
MVGVDSLSCGSPITDPTFYYYNDSAKFISYRSYAASDAGGALMLVSSMTKINAESNATRLALSLFTAGGTMDSSKIFETISTSAQIITSDSVMVKSPSGVWTDYSRASNSFSAGGDWFYRLQMVRQGAWVTTDSIVSLALGSGYEIYRPSPDSLSTYFWDEWGNDTLEVTAIKTDTTYRHWINTYDDNDNIIREVGYTSDKSGSNKLKTDSSAFTNAQIRISSVRRNRIFSAADAVSFEQTPAMLRVWAAGITGLRLYDLSGRMLASVNQLPAPTIFFTWHSLRTRSAKQLYAAQVITGRGIITQTLRNISQF